MSDEAKLAVLEHQVVRQAEQIKHLEGQASRVESRVRLWQLIGAVAAFLGVTGGALSWWAKIQSDTVVSLMAGNGLQHRADEAVAGALRTQAIEHVFVAAAAVYLDTGIDIEAGQDIELRITGAVNSALAAR